MTSRPSHSAPDTIDEADLVELRPVVLGLCYRMLACPFAAEGAAQETLTRTWRQRNRFDPARASLRTWSLRIATNVCIDHLRSASRRSVPTDLEGPSTPTADVGAPIPNSRLVMPIPTRVLEGETVGLDPAAAVGLRESVRLAFVAALQHLSPVERATLLLREVFALPASEVAAGIGRSEAAVTSALGRARRKLAEHDLSLDGGRSGRGDGPDGPDHPCARRSYVAAFGAHDIAAMVALIADDVAMTMPPYPWWARGRDHVRASLEGTDFCRGTRLVPVSVNGAAGFGHYLPLGEGGRLGDRRHRPRPRVLQAWARRLRRPRSRRSGPG